MLYRYFNKQNLQEAKDKYSITISDAERILVTRRVNNPTYKGGTCTYGTTSFRFPLTCDNFHLKVLRSVVYDAIRAGLDPIETMMRIYNYAYNRHKNVTDRNRAEFSGVIMAIATPEAKRSTVQQIMVLQAALDDTEKHKLC